MILFKFFFIKETQATFIPRVRKGKRSPTAYSPLPLPNSDPQVLLKTQGRPGLATIAAIGIRPILGEALTR
jgi:hypothetical protein